MKKITIVLTAIVMLFATTAFAMEGENVSPKVKASFKSSFAGASQVKWEKVDRFYFATFQLNYSGVTAAYDEDGMLVGTSRKISVDELPMIVSVALSEKFAGYKADKAVTELTYEGQTRYYVTVGNDKEEVDLKCLNTGEISVESKKNK